MGKNKRFKTLTPPTPQLPAEYVFQGTWKLAGKELSHLAEEMLWNCARYYEHEIYWEKLVKNGNFIQCLTPELSSEQKALNFPEDYKKLLSEMKALQEKQKEEKAEWRKLHKEEVKKEKAAKDALKEQFGYAVVDGEKIAVPYLVEGPGIIITRGEDPRFGCWKYRVKTGDITVNCVDGDIPQNWKGKVESSPTSQWVFKYKMQCGRPGMKTYMEIPKKVNLSGDIAKKNVAKKFDKTMKVIENWSAIEKHILDGIKSNDPIRKQSALIAYLIAETGIRVGNSRDLDKFADTQGASTLKKEAFTFKG